MMKMKRLPEMPHFYLMMTEVYWIISSSRPHHGGRKAPELSQILFKNYALLRVVYLMRVTDRKVTYNYV
jgi:hypothetical protein